MERWQSVSQVLLFPTVNTDAFPFNKALSFAQTQSITTMQRIKCGNTQKFAVNILQLLCYQVQIYSVHPKVMFKCKLGKTVMRYCGKLKRHGLRTEKEEIRRDRKAEIEMETDTQDRVYTAIAFTIKSSVQFNSNVDCPVGESQVGGRVLAIG